MSKFYYLAKRDAPRVTGKRLFKYTTNLPDNLFKCFACGKSRCFSRGNVDRGSSLRITSGSGFSGPYHECPESGNDHFVTFLSESVIEPNTATTASRAALAVRLAFCDDFNEISFCHVVIHLPSGRGLERDKNFWGPPLRAL